MSVAHVSAPAVTEPHWAADIAASIVVFLVALPLCLGVALASGAPLMSGVIAGIIGGLVVAPLSGSSLMVSGPAAGLTAIVLSAITTLGSFEVFLAAVFLSGVLQIGFGALKAGGVVNYVPSGVIRGMLAAIGLILILKQLPHALGYDDDVMGDVRFQQSNDENTLTALVSMFSSLEPAAILCSATGLLLLFAWPRMAVGRLKLVPGALIVVVAGLAINALLLQLHPAWALAQTHLVTLPIVTDLEDAAALFVMPRWSALDEAPVIRVAITLAIVASLETLLSLEATDRLDPRRKISPPNRELVAQGAGNMLSGLLGGLPITGVIVRSAANITAGGKTRWSAILHGALLLLAVALLPWLLNKIPLAALAAILIFTGLKLASPRLMRGLYRQGWEAFVPFGATVIAILFTDLLIGIGVGLAVAGAIILRTHLLTPGYRYDTKPGSVLIRVALDDQVTFLSKARILRMLESLPSGARIEIDGTNSRRIDRDVLEMLHEYVGTAEERGIDYRLHRIPPLIGETLSGH